MEHTQISSDNENWNKYNYGWKRELLKLSWKRCKEEVDSFFFKKIRLK